MTDNFALSAQERLRASDADRDQAIGALASAVPHLMVRSVLGNCHLEMQHAVIRQQVTTIDATRGPKFYML
jgi:hypothetical protein